jgi:hypothetical protein
MAATPIILQVSQAFCCNTCHSPVALVVQMGGDLTYECMNVKCQRVVSVDCPEALTLVENVTIELPTPAQLGRRIGAYHAMKAVTL